MRPLRYRIGLAAFVTALLGCSEGQETSQPISALVRVHDGAGTYAQHLEGALPGTPTAPDPDDAGQSEALVVHSETTPGWVYQGQSNGKFNGTLSADAVAVGIAVPDLVDGYWVKPAGASDPVTKDLTWAAMLDVAEAVPPGYHDVSLVALDGSGHGGPILTFPLCVRSRVPDNFNACEPSSASPNAVISLSWDTNVDLDLQLVDSTGYVTDAKNPTTKVAGDEPLEDAGVLDRDSNGGCVIDGIRYENVTWDTSRPRGLYGIYVNLFDSCGKATVHFDVSIYVAEPQQGAAQRLKRVYTRSGVLVDYQANGGEGRGLFITEYDFTDREEG